MKEGNRKKIIKILNYTTIVIFVGLICLPLFSQLSGISQNEQNSEKRTLAEIPKLPKNIRKVDDFFLEFEAYYNDNFGLRDDYLSANQYIKYELFEVTTSPNVTLGKDGWLFYNETLDDYKNRQRFSEEELEVWGEILGERRTWLKERDIDYYFVIAPNKNTIYPELMPDQIHIHNRKDKADQLVEYLQQNTDIQVVFPKNDLISSKETRNLYYANDTHWNSYGAYIGYQSISNEIKKNNPEIEPYIILDYEIEQYDKTGGDLALMLGKIDERRSIEPALVWENNYNAQLVEQIENEDHTAFKLYHSTANAPSIMIYHDSFGEQIAPFFFNTYSQVALQPDSLGFSKVLIEEYKPDIFIQEVVERNLDTTRLEEYQKREQ